MTGTDRFETLFWTIVKAIDIPVVMKRSKLLLNGLIGATVLFMSPSKVSSMPSQLQADIRKAMQTGDFRQGVQLGAMAGSMSSFCMMAKEGIVVPGEGPVTDDVLNNLSSKLLAKARSEFDEYIFSYQKIGLNIGISECNKILGVQLDYR